MRILFLDTKPIRRGAQIFVHALSDELNNLGVVTKRLYLFSHADSVKLSLNDEDEVLGADEKNWTEKYLTIQPRLLSKLINSIDKFNPDIILLNGSKTLKYGALAKVFSKNKFQLVYRVIDSPKFWNRSVLTKIYYRKLIIPKIDAAVGVSQASLNDMIELYHFLKPSIVIHRAVNFETFANCASKTTNREQLGLSNDAFVVLFLGNLTVQKRPDRFIEIIKMLSSRINNINAIIVGDGPLRYDMEKAIKESGIQSVIKLFGYQANVGPFISASDILLLTSDTEGLPGIVPEAGYFNVPTMAAEVGGVAECIANNQSGIIIDRSDIEQFVEKSIYLFKNPDVRMNMGAAAHKIAMNHFDIKMITNRYFDFFKKLQYDHK